MSNLTYRTLPLFTEVKEKVGVLSFKKKNKSIHTLKCVYNTAVWINID